MKNETQTQPLSRKKLADLTGVRASTIKFYSEAGLLPYHQAEEGLARRYDQNQAVERLKEIRALQALGLSITDIGNRLRG